MRFRRSVRQRGLSKTRRAQARDPPRHYHSAQPSGRRLFVVYIHAGGRSACFAHLKNRPLSANRARASDARGPPRDPRATQPARDGAGLLAVGDADLVLRHVPLRSDHLGMIAPRETRRATTPLHYCTVRDPDSAEVRSISDGATALYIAVEMPPPCGSGGTRGASARARRSARGAASRGAHGKLPATPVPAESSRPSGAEPHAQKASRGCAPTTPRHDGRTRGARRSSHAATSAKNRTGPPRYSFQTPRRGLGAISSQLDFHPGTALASLPGT